MRGFNSALITGATGFIGSALVKGLLNRGVEVFSVVRHATTNHSKKKDLDGSHIIKVRNFTSSEIYKSISSKKIDIVYNLAGYGVNPEDSDPELMLEGNLDVLVQLLLAMKELSIKKFIHVGSCSEYSIAESGTFISEDQPLRPWTLYGAAKASSSIYGHALAKELGVPFFTLRLFGVFGVGEAPHRLIPYLVGRLKEDAPVDLTPGEQVRDLLYIDDVVHAFLEAGACDGLLQYPVYNVCSSQPVCIRDVGRMVADMMNKPTILLQWGRRSYRENDPMWLVGDKRRFEQATKWRPKVSLQEGIQKMIKDGRLLAALE